MTSNNKDSIIEADGMQIDLKNRTIAGILAFLWPGAGHWYQGRYGKAGLFSTCILGLFVVGMILGNGKVVYASWDAQDYRWHYVLQAGVGLPAMPAALQWYFGSDSESTFLRGWMAEPASMNVLSDWHFQTSAGFDLGTLYTMVAGLLNVLVIFDACAGPMAIPGHESRKKKPLQEVT